MSDLKLDFGSLRAAFRAGMLRPQEVVNLVFERIASHGNHGVWITLAERDDVLLRASELDAIPADHRSDFPLYGLPFSVKDNIDVAGIPTTAACPEFAYTPSESSTVVKRLLAAGAIFIGKTNLDQFATGLVGTRTPYGSARNPFNDAYLSGGSSSGSAVSVSAGLVSFALGSDTGGSGRVPASYTNTVGVKPTRGLLSNKGSVWACRSIDCISIYGLTTEDAMDVWSVAQCYDPADPYSRLLPAQCSTLRTDESFRFAVPRYPDLDFAGCEEAADLFVEARGTLESIGGESVEIDYAPFREVNDMMFKGPLLAERYVSVGAFIERNPESCLPVTRRTIEEAKAYSAIEMVRMNYRIAEIKRDLEQLWSSIDVLFVPTIPRPYTLDEIEADPVGHNLRHGTYTYFVNPLDLAAIAVPSGFLSNGVPYGVSILGPAFSDLRIAALASRFHKQSGLPLGCAV